MKNTVAIYHRDCIDGTVAAAVILRKFLDAKLFPLGHGYEPADLESIFAAIDEDTTIYTVDCGNGVKELLERGYAVTTLDHHIGAKKDFEKLAAGNGNFTFVFDNEKSGASLAWSYFFPEEPAPDFIQYVEDIDLGRGQYRDSARGVGNYLYMFRNDPEAMRLQMESDFDELRMKGSAVSMSADKEIEDQLDTTPLTIKVGDYTVPAYNISIHKSVCGAVLSEREGKTVAIFTLKGDTARISFRGTEPQKPTALDLATILGGGGHEYAAAARIPLTDFFEMIQH